MRFTFILTYRLRLEIEISRVPSLNREASIFIEGKSTINRICPEEKALTVKISEIPYAMDMVCCSIWVSLRKEYALTIPGTVRTLV